MKQDLRKVLSAIIVIISLVLLGAVLIFAPVCDKLIELKSGNMTHMSCFYTSKATILLSVLLLVAGISSFFSRGSQWIIISIGILLIVLTFNSSIGMGICKKDTMACHTTAIWIRAGGIITIVCGILMLFKKKENNTIFGS